MKATSEDPNSFGDIPGPNAFMAPGSPNTHLSTGAATHSIPIEVPPGRKVFPQLAVVYNSFQANSWLGVGWDLPIGVIQRSTKNGLDYSALDFIASFGATSSELVPRFSEWGEGRYGNKIEGAFLKYTNTDPSSNGWSVKDKSGTTFYFGRYSSTRQSNSEGIFKWYLDKVQDVNGNYMEISYQQGAGEDKYPHVISYTAHTNGLAPAHTVEFNLEVRPDRQTNYAGHSNIELTRRLAAIEIKTNGVLARKYAFTYEYSAATARSLLRQITQYGSDGVSTLPPMTFDWQPASIPQREEAVGTFNDEVSGPIRTLDTPHVYFQVFDVDKDGKADFVYDADPQDYGRGIRVRFSSGTGFPTEVGGTIRATAYNSKYKGFQVGDINGDGFPDLIYLNSNKRIHVMLGTGLRPPDGSPFSEDTTIALELVKNPNTPIQVVDLNGDGRADIIYDGYLNTTRGEFRIRLGNADGGFDPEPAEPWGIRLAAYDADLKDFQMADVNGDGLPDVVYETNRNVHVLLNTGSGFSGDVVWKTLAHPYHAQFHGFQMADVNGDGLADLIYNGVQNYTQNQFRVLLSRGNGFEDDAPWGTKTYDYFNGLSPALYFTMADLNGDGLADVIYDGTQGSAAVGIQVKLSTGKSFQPEQQYGFPAYCYGSNGFRVADFTGDGIPDLVYDGEDCRWNICKTPCCPESEKYCDPYCLSYGHIMTMTAPGPYPDLLKTINNGVGGKHTISYKPYSITTNGVLPYTFQTVSSIASDDGNGNISTTRYAYSGGYYNVPAREFRGFAIVKQTLPNLTTVTSAFHQDDVKKGLMYDQRTRNADGVTYTRQVNTYETTAPFTGTFFPYLAQNSQYIYDGQESAQQIRTSFDYDQYGNLKMKCSEGDVSIEGDERCDFIDYQTPDTTRWLLARPQAVRTREGLTVNDEDLSKTSFTYAPGTNNILTKTLWLDGGNSPVITYDYDDYGNVIAQYDPKGNGSTLFEYDSTKTLLTKVTNPKGHESFIYYDDPDDPLKPYGKPYQKKDANNNSTFYKYDAFGRLLKETGPYDTLELPTKSWTYNDSQRYVSVALRVEHAQSGVNTVKTCFDGFGREISKRSPGPDGVSIFVDTQYDTSGKVRFKSFPYFYGGQIRWIEYAYDCLGRPLSTTRPDGENTSITYNKKRTGYFGPGDYKKMVDRDVYGRTVKVYEYTSMENPDTYSTTTYEYDPLGNLRFIYDSENNPPLEIRYDTLSRKVWMNDPDMGTWTYGYDLNGNLEWQNDALQQTINFEYDELNRPTFKKYPDATQVAYTYDTDYSSYENETGRLTKVVDPSGTTEMHYDKEGRVWRSRKIIDGISYYFDYTFDAMGRTKSVRYPAPAGETRETANYAYRPGGAISTVRGDSDYAAFASDKYDALGQPGQIDFGNGARTVLSYYDQTNSRLQQMVTTCPVTGTIQNLSYAYENGNIKTITDGSDVSTFTYDRINRLLTAQRGSDPLISLTYSKSGNIETNSRVGTAAYTYGDPAHPHAVTAAGSNTYGYDANGNMTTKNGANMTYDYDNRLKSVGSGTSFVYDWQGQRVKKITSTSTTVYIGKLYEVTDGAVTRHIFAGSRRIASKTGTEVYYYHPDHLGGLNFVTDSSGARVQKTLYHPYGENRYNSGMADLPHKFTGQEKDATGFYYFGARYYDPVAARFISPDSIVPSPGNPQSLNRYSYCLNNPVNAIDPTGHFSIGSFFSSLIGGIIGGMMMFFTGNPILAGMAAGGFSGAVSGDPRNIIMGVAMGGFSGALGSVVQSNLGTVGMIGMIGISAGSAVSKGGWESLAYMGAGMVGGAMGYSAAGIFKVGPTASTGSSNIDYSQLNKDVPQQIAIPDEIQMKLAPYLSDPTTGEGGVDLSQKTLHKGLP